jgi:hypothetical protein
MNYDNLSNNDDDLFAESTSSSTISNENISSSELNIDNLLSSLDVNLDNIDSMLFRARIVTTLIDTSNKFIYETNSYNRSIFNTLNSLTNGEFQYTLYAETLEESIFRRVLILEFLNSCTDQMDEKILSLLSKATNTTIDSKFINTYIVAMKNILVFSIDYNISVYHTLCEKINRQPIDFDIELNSHIVESYINSSSYINSVFTNIRKSLGFGTAIESN